MKIFVRIKLKMTFINIIYYCILSPRLFTKLFFLKKVIDKYFLFQNEREVSGVQGWALICDTMLSRSIGPGTVFQLRQGDVSLLCSVHPLPHLNISEEIIDPKSNKFVLRMSSETSVWWHSQWWNRATPVPVIWIEYLLAPTPVLIPW